MRIGIAFRLAAAIAACLCVLDAAGADAALPDYAVVSIVGDRFTVANRDTDARRAGKGGLQVALGSAAIDGAALADASASIKKRAPDATVSLVLVREPAVFEAQEEVMGVTRDTQALVDALEPVISRVRAKRLLLLSKVREPAEVRFANVLTERPAFLEGLGFYLDGAVPVQDTETLDRAHGFLGVFAHFRASLVDLSTRRVLDEERVAVVMAVRDPRKDLWETMTAEQKVAAIKSLLAEQVDLAVGRLLERSR